MDFEVLEHPADIGFRAKAASLEGLFVNCALALQSLILDPSDIHPTKPVTIDATGADSESLLVNFLNEVLYYIDGKRLALAQLSVTLTSDSVRCTASAEPRDRHPARLVVKAVTYHQLKVVQDADGWIAEVYVDI